jgi:hypothetical protein
LGETVLAIITLDCNGELRGSYHGTSLPIRWPHVDKFTQVHSKEAFPTVKGAGNAHAQCVMDGLCGLILASSHPAVIWIYTIRGVTVQLVITSGVLK